MSLPPLLDWFTRQFDESPILAVLIALGVLLVAVVLARIAMKLLLLFVILLAVAIGVSYLFAGEEETERVLRKGAGEVLERGEELPEAPR
jgi:hypothetical protein